MLGLHYVGRVDGVPSFVATQKGASFWCSGSRAVTLAGTVVVYADREAFHDTVVRQHEFQHVLQARALGRIRFCRLYGYYQRTLGYQDNPLEVGARHAAERTRQDMLDRLRQHGLLR
jgi:hypothetical protein